MSCRECNMPRDYTIRNGSIEYLKSYLKAMDAICNMDSNLYGGDYWKNIKCNCPDCQLIEYYPPRPQPDINFDDLNQLFNDGDYVGYYRNLYNLDD